MHINYYSWLPTLNLSTQSNLSSWPIPALIYGDHYNLTPFIKILLSLEFRSVLLFLYIFVPLYYIIIL